MNAQPLQSVRFLAVHCSATPAAPSHENWGAAEIRAMHRKKGWLDIGYHYVIKRDGTVEKGRPDTQVGAHEPKINRISLGICLIGGSPPLNSPAFKRGEGENNFTPAQFKALAGLLRKLKGAHPNAEIIGHRDVPGVAKACPSFSVKDWVKTVGL